ncbi:MAG: hypothetical protein H6510_06565 [Acidobacteria bacterium]|nr:hypothetical protein [Acidobacteriota bacterium]MCB9397457.1 hypothetical protein [Acidobacteriota bacterium]
MNLSNQSDTAPIRRILLKNPQQAFRSQEFVDREWERLFFTARPDFKKAVREYDAFQALLEKAGIETLILPENDQTSLDSLYPRDTAIMTAKGAILCQMGKAARQHEPLATGAYLDRIGVPVLGQIEGHGKIEGGDLTWLNPRTVCVAHGYRTNREGIRQLIDFLGDLVDEVLVMDAPHWNGPTDVFHMMSVLSPVDTNKLLVYSRLMTVPFRNALLDRDFQLIEVPDEEWESQGCNVLAVAPGHCIAVEGNPITRQRLEKAGCQVEVFLGQEISVKGCGGPTCLTRPLERG